MPRYFFDIKDGHRLFDASGFVCDDDTDAIIRATVLAIGVSLDKPEDDPERRIAVINDAGREIGTVPVYSKPSYEHPAWDAAAKSALAIGREASRWFSETLASGEDRGGIARTM